MVPAENLCWYIRASMGAACCVAARDRTIQHGSSGEILHRNFSVQNFRHSPTWNFRRDNRIGVAGEETSIGGSSAVGGRNDVPDAKSAATDVSARVSDGGGLLESCPTGTWRKSPLNHEFAKNLKTCASGQCQSIARNTSIEVTQSRGSPQVSDPPAVKLSPSVHLSSQSHPLPIPPSSTPSRWVRGSPAHQPAHQPFDNHSSGRNPPSINSISKEKQVSYGTPAASYESTRGSHGRSSDGWLVHAFSELMSASQREQWSFSSDRNSRSISMDFPTCGICSKLLTEKSAWSSQKIIAGDESSVVAVLICGHVYHAECLETITPEIDKYDPGCPVCTFGEKKTLKMFGKMLKVEKDLKAKSSMKSKNRVVDTNESFHLDYWKSSPHEGKSPKLKNSSSLKISAAKPFMRRHFSFGSRGNKSASENLSITKKGLFWAKSSRE